MSKDSPTLYSLSSEECNLNIGAEGGAHQTFHIFSKDLKSLDSSVSMPANSSVVKKIIVQPLSLLLVGDHSI
jgi:hypothetical protein